MYSKEVFSLLFVTVFVGTAGANKPEIHFPPAVAAILRPKVIKCAQEAKGNLVDLLDQATHWEIKDEDKMKIFITCTYRDDENGAKIDPMNVLAMFGDFEKKEEILKLVEECGSKLNERSSFEKIFLFYTCFMHDSPVTFNFNELKKQ